MRRFFGVAERCFQSDPGAPGGGAPRGHIECGFCGCGLGADGGVLKTSTRARELARIDEKIERLEGELATARGRVTELTGELAAAVAKLAAVPPVPEPPAPRRGGLHFD